MGRDLLLLFFLLPPGLQGVLIFNSLSDLSSLLRGGREGGREGKRALSGLEWEGRRGWMEKGEGEREGEGGKRREEAPSQPTTTHS